MSSTFLYCDEVRFIQNRLNKIDSRVNYIYHVGQYLPDWHPWEDYKSFFVGNARTNGCRELMAIELPWLVKTFGSVKKIIATGGKISKLDVDYPDNFQLIIEHKNGTKDMLAVDIVSRKAVRSLEIYGEEIFISWDGSPTGLRDYDFNDNELKVVDLYDDVDYQSGYASFIVENAYRNELVAYFNRKPSTMSTMNQGTPHSCGA